MTDEERARRIIEAILANLDTWTEQALEIADHAHVSTDNKRRGLHLAKSLAQAKASLRRLAGLPDEVPKEAGPGDR